MNHSEILASYLPPKGVRVTIDPANPASIVQGLAAYLWKVSQRIPLPPFWEQEDLLQIGLMAALECVREYKPEAGAFAPFAKFVASAAMKDASVENRGPCRVPATSVWNGAAAVQIYNDSYRESFSINDDVRRQDGSETKEAGAFELSCPPDTENTVAIRLVLQRLPEEERGWFLDEAEGKPLREMAIACGWSDQTILNRKKAALDRLGL